VLDHLLANRKPVKDLTGGHETLSADSNGE
jgi:hypothetical protein